MVSNVIVVRLEFGVGNWEDDESDGGVVSDVCLEVNKGFGVNVVSSLSSSSESESSSTRARRLGMSSSSSCCITILFSFGDLETGFVFRIGVDLYAGEWLGLAVYMFDLKIRFCDPVTINNCIYGQRAMFSKFCLLEITI